jgi:hypothetical protein
VGGRVEPLGPLGQGLLGPSGITVEGQLKQGLVSIAPGSSVGAPSESLPIMSTASDDRPLYSPTSFCTILFVYTIEIDTLE